MSVLIPADYKPRPNVPDGPEPSGVRLPDIGGREPKPRSILEEQDAMDFVTSVAAKAESTYRGLSQPDDAGPGFTVDLVQKLENQRPSLLEGAPDDLARRDAEAELDRVIERARHRGAEIEQAVRIANRARTAEQTLGQFVAAATETPEMAESYLSDGLRVLDRVAKAGGSLSAVGERAAAFRRQLARAALSGQRHLDPELAKVRFDAGDFDPLIPDDETRKVIMDDLHRGIDAAAVQRRIDEEEAAARARLDAARRRSAFETKFERALRDRTATVGDIELARESGEIEGATADRLTARLRDAQTEAMTRQGRIDAAEELFRAGGRANADNPGEVAAVNAYFEDAFAPGLDTLDPVVRAEDEDFFVHRAGVVPDGIARGLRGGLRTRDPERLVQTADRVGALMADDILRRHLETVLPPDRLGLAEAIFETHDEGLSAQERVEIAQEEVRKSHSESEESQSSIPEMHRLTDELHDVAKGVIQHSQEDASQKSARPPDATDQPPVFRLDPKSRYPTLVNPKTGEPILAPDGKPFDYSPGRAKEILEIGKGIVKKPVSEMSPQELKELHEFSVNFGAFVGVDGDEKKAAPSPPENSMDSRTTEDRSDGIKSKNGEGKQQNGRTMKDRAKSLLRDATKAVDDFNKTPIPDPIVDPTRPPGGPPSGPPGVPVEPQRRVITIPIPVPVLKTK